MGAMPLSEHWRRHARLAATAAALAAGLYALLGLSPEHWRDVHALKAESDRWRVSMALAYSALAFFAATLAVGPLYALRTGRPRPHLPVRRALGWWTAGLALAHMGVGSLVHVTGWRFWESFVYAWPGPGQWLPVLRDQRGLANYLGLAAAGLLAGLAVISTDAALRQLGLARWKSLQRLSYLAFGLMALHGLLYQLIEERWLPARLVVIGLLSSIGVAQLAGAAAILRRRAAGPSIHHHSQRTSETP
jgi:methionine sulfoxide reductase heme-binding subunit